MSGICLAFSIRNALRTELSWTHYRRLSSIPDSEARMWYMNECAESHWSTRQLERQINTMFRERLLASKDKKTVSAEIQKSAPARRPEDIIRDPYVLEFLAFRMMPLSAKAISSRRSSRICRSSCWSSAAVSPSRRARSASRSTDGISTSIWCFTTTSCAASCSSI